MPRKPRFFVPGLAAHVIQRGNNRQAIFFETADYELYLSLVGEGRDRYGCSIHAYVLMTNHVHLLLTPMEKSSVSRMMQYVGVTMSPISMPNMRAAVRCGKGGSRQVLLIRLVIYWHVIATLN